MKTSLKPVPLMKPLLSRFSPRYHLVALCCILAAWASSTGLNAADFVTKAVVGSGNSWSAPLIWSNPPNTTLTAPAAGNTYRLLFNGTQFGNNQGNTRVRNPAAAGVQTFPGDVLIMDANTEIRPKVSGAILNFPGVGGNAGLVLNGGALGAGDDAVFEFRGSINVISDSLIATADNGVGAIKPLRGLKFTASLAGTESLIIIQGATNIPTVEVLSANNSFSGRWVVKAGLLKGSAAGSLGAGSILIDPNYVVSSSLLNPTTTGVLAGPALLEFTYDHTTPGSLTLANG